MQNALVASLVATIKATDRVLQQQSGKALDKEVITSLTDAIALGLQCFHDINNTRRLAMKKDLHKDYVALCSASIVPASSEYLFGDLSKLAKDRSEANKLTKKVRPLQRSTARCGNSGSNGRRFYQNTQGSQGYRRFHPYQRQRKDFLYKGRPQKSRIKKEGDSKQA